MITIAVVVYHPTACPKGPGTQTMGPFKGVTGGYMGTYGDSIGVYRTQIIGF